MTVDPGELDGGPLVGLAAEVTPNMVKAHLTGRSPRILETINEEHDLYLNLVRGIALEVEAVVGRDLPAGEKRRMSVWAITFGVAANLESSLFPEQQLGDDGRADWLMRRYLGLLSSLPTINDAGVNTGGVPAPMGDFPSPAAYPDAAFPAARVAWSGGSW